MLSRPILLCFTTQLSAVLKFVILLLPAIPSAFLFTYSAISLQVFISKVAQMPKEEMDVLPQVKGAKKAAKPRDFGPPPSLRQHTPVNPAQPSKCDRQFFLFSIP